MLQGSSGFTGGTRLVHRPILIQSDRGTSDGCYLADPAGRTQSSSILSGVLHPDSRVLWTALPCRRLHLSGIECPQGARGCQSYWFRRFDRKELCSSNRIMAKRANRDG